MWPTSRNDDAPSLVIGETHHPTMARESERPSWLVSTKQAGGRSFRLRGEIDTEGDHQAKLR